VLPESRSFGRLLWVAAAVNPAAVRLCAPGAPGAISNKCQSFATRIIMVDNVL
jgi:hypothetical protein